MSRLKSIPLHILFFIHLSFRTRKCFQALEANFVNFNGDDAIGLFKNGSLIDIVGEKGSTNKYGENKTLRRKPSVKTPNPVFTLDEWEELEVDEISGLGSHIME